MKTAEKGKPWLAPALVLAAFAAVLFALFWPGNNKVDLKNREPGLKSIQLEISDGDLHQLQSKRDEALRIGILQTREGDWVDAVLKENELEYPGKIRLKGDWTDHLKGEKWSYRVKLEEGNAWCGLTVFSLQNPESRNFLLEWLFHQFLQTEDVLTTKYDFVRLFLNQQDLGIYAIEEHFTPGLLQAQKRPPGPLIKMSEAGVWEIRVAEMTRGLEPECDLSVFESATIEPFGGINKGGPEFTSQFELAQNLLDQARFRLRPHGELFDIERAAKRHAATDIFKAFHSLTWHNQRWYYNPFSGKLEPVVYDGYPGTDLRYQFQGPFSGYQASGLHIDQRYSELMDAPFYQDSIFLEKYYHQLWKYSTTQYLNQFLDSMQVQLDEREAFIQEEFIFYHYDYDFLKSSISQIQEVLQQIEQPENGLKLDADKDGGWIRNKFPFPVVLSRKDHSEHLLHAREPDYPDDYIRFYPSPEWTVEIPGTGHRVRLNGY